VCLKKGELMAAPYSVDLRKRVIEEAEKKELTKNQISALFKIDLKTIYNWVKAKKISGTIEPKSGYQKGHSHKITDTEKFKIFIADSPNLSLQELSEKWGGVSSTTIGNMLHKIGYTVKKNNGAIRNAKNTKEQNI
jgi:transposase